MNGGEGCRAKGTDKRRRRLQGERSNNWVASCGRPYYLRLIGADFSDE